jgi:hypothetical protein
MIPITRPDENFAVAQKARVSRGNIPAALTSVLLDFYTASDLTEYQRNCQRPIEQTFLE